MSSMLNITILAGCSTNLNNDRRGLFYRSISEKCRAAHSVDLDSISSVFAMGYPNSERRSVLLGEATSQWSAPWDSNPEPMD